MTGLRFFVTKNKIVLEPKLELVGGCQARRAVLLFAAEGVGAEDIPRTSANESSQWVRRWRERWGVAVRAVAHLSTLSDAVVSERVERFWQFCKWVQSTSPGAVWVNFDETPLWFCQRTGRIHILKKQVRGGDPVRLVGDPSRKEPRAGRSGRDPTTLANQPGRSAQLLLYMTQERRLAAGPESGPKTRASP